MLGLIWLASMEEIGFMVSARWNCKKFKEIDFLQAVVSWIIRRL